MARTWIDWSCEGCGRPQTLSCEEGAMPLDGRGSGCKVGIRLSEKVCFVLRRPRDVSRGSGDSRLYLGRFLTHSHERIQNSKIAKAYGAQGELCLSVESLMVKHVSTPKTVWARALARACFRNHALVPPRDPDPQQQDIWPVSSSVRKKETWGSDTRQACAPGPGRGLGSIPFEQHNRNAVLGFRSSIPKPPVSPRQRLTCPRDLGTF
jgi:hypothetical protein